MVKALLTEHGKALRALAQALLEEEQLAGERAAEIVREAETT